MIQLADGTGLGGRLQKAQGIPQNLELLVDLSGRTDGASHGEAKYSRPRGPDDLGYPPD